MLGEYTDGDTELRVRSMKMASVVATGVYDFDVSAAPLDEFVETYFDAVKEYMGAPGWKQGDALLVREGALQTVVTLCGAPNVKKAGAQPGLAALLDMAKTMSHTLMPDLAEAEAKQEKRLQNRFAPPRG
jgi:hypothetical protein